ncbi:MAG: OmpA family protein [Bacteroidales bacterium]|nr:OmpA family protein [Bacteroidales bacterium]
MKKIILLSAVVFLASSILAQETDDKKTKSSQSKPNSWSVSLNGGSTQFYGDVGTNIYYYPWFPAEGEISYSVFGTFEKNFSPFYGLRIRGGYADYSSVSSGSQPNTIESTLFDIYVENKIYLSNILFPEVYKKKWASFLTVGYGIPFYRTLLKDYEDNIIGWEGYSDNGETKESFETAGSISVGIGVRLRLSQQFALSAEASIEGLNSDKLDAYENPLSEYDKYGYTSIGVVYTFGKNDEQVPLEYNPVPSDELAMKKKLDSLGNELAKLGKKVDGIDDEVEQLSARWNGPDADNDGIADSYDKEPNTEPGAMVNHNGETIKDFTEEIENMTKTEVETGHNPNTSVAYESIFFALNSSYITSEGMKKLAKIAQIMNKNKDVKFKIIGSTCELASKEYNKDLSERRAKAAKEKLVERYGIDASRLMIEFIGEEKPLADKPLYINRRADFYIIK